MMAAMRRSPLLVATLLPAVLALAGCSDGGGGDSITTGDDYSVTGALAELPASVADGDVPGNLMIETGDLARASEVASTPRPSDVGDADAIADWLSAFSTDAEKAFVPLGPELFIYSGAWDDLSESYGWSPLDLDSFVSTTQLTVGHTDGDIELPDDLPRSGGVATTGEGEVGEINREADQLDPFSGIVTGMVADGDQLAFGTSADQLEDWQGDGDSLADDETLAAVAGGLDEHDVYSAILVQAPAGAGPADLDADVEALGVGWSQDRIWAVWSVAGDPDAASDVLGQALTEGTTATTQTPVSDYLALEDISVDGDLVVAELTPGPEGQLATPYAMVRRAESPLVS
jgi:hypothetical protein